MPLPDRVAELVAQFEANRSNVSHRDSDGGYIADIRDLKY